MNTPVANEGKTSADQSDMRRRRRDYHHIEVLLLAASLLATVIISALTLQQTKRHFEIERTSSFVTRFNSQEMVDLREHVDRWLEGGETPEHLYERSNKLPGGLEVRQDGELEAKDALMTIARMRTMANYFQEFGTALKIGSLNEEYAHELLGSLCIRYGKSLEPFIMETRKRRERPQVYEEVFLLKERMEALDKSTH